MKSQFHKHHVIAVTRALTLNTASADLRAREKNYDSHFNLHLLKRHQSQRNQTNFIESIMTSEMNDLHASTGERIAAAIATDSSHAGSTPQKLGELTSSEQDDLDLQKLGYKSVLARGWGSFDNFACSFSALYCIGGIRVLFYIALSAGGPAAM
jgi:hypothetical protein